MTKNNGMTTKQILKWNQTRKDKLVKAERSVVRAAVQEFRLHRHYCTCKLCKSVTRYKKLIGRVKCK